MEENSQVLREGERERERNLVFRGFFCVIVLAVPELEEKKEIENFK